MSAFRSFLTNASWNVFGKICVQVLLLGVSILITRYLGKERLGLYATILVIPNFIRLLNGFGLEMVINKKLPELQVNDPSLGLGRYALRRLLLLRLVSSLVLGSLLYLFLPSYFTLIQMPELAVYRVAIIAYFCAITINSLLSTLFMTYLKYKVTSAVDSVNVLLNMLFLAVFIYLDWGILGVLYAYIWATGVTIAVYFYLAVPYIVGETRKSEWGDAKQLAWVSYVMGIFSFGLMSQSDVIVMNYFNVEPARVGYYHLGMGLSGMLAFVILAGIGPLALSIFSKTFASDSHAGLAVSWRQIVGFSFFCTAPIYVFAFLNSRELIVFIYGEQFAPASAVLSFYLVFMLANMALGGSFMASLLSVVQKSGMSLRAIVESSILNIVLDIIFIPHYKELGAVAATGTALVFMAVRQLATVRKVIEMKIIMLFVGRCFLFSIVAVLPSVVQSVIGWNHLILNFIIYAVSLVLLLGWLKPLSEGERGILSGIQPRLGELAKWFVRSPGQ